MHWLCLLPPAFSLIFLLHPQTPFSVFSLHRGVIPHQNNGLLCFIELPLSVSHFLYSFPPFICCGLFFSSAHSFSFIVFTLLGGLVAEMEKWKIEATKKEDEWRMQGFVWNSEGEREKKIDKLAKEDRRWRETWNNGKWTARSLLENGGLDRE